LIYSKTCQYAIRALNYLATLETKKPATVGEVHAKTGVPQAYVAKIFQCLTRAKIVASKSGPNGGYALRVDPAKLTLLRVVDALDDVSESPLSNCVMGQAECSDRNPCCLHTVWVKAAAEMKKKLAKVTILEAGKATARAYRSETGRTVLSRRMQKVFGYGTAKGDRE